MQLEEKEEQIEQLKQQIELLESTERDLQTKVNELTEDNESLDKQVKKWIAKFDQEIEKNSCKFAELNNQIKNLQEDKF